MKEIKRIRLEKNRGWRGLAELVCEDEERKVVHKMIFSFSQPVWDDLLQGYIVIQDEDNYFILNFDNTESLPKPTQQRSVLIKSFLATVVNITAYPKNEEVSPLTYDYSKIYHFKKNRNNHTTSSWNCIRSKSNTRNIGGVSMRIAKKDIERLTYVEKALSKRDDHLAKVVHNVLHELNPEFIFIIQEEGCWDGELIHHTEVYASFGDALNSYKNLVRVARSDIREWISEDQISESEQIDEEAGTASFETYESGDFTRLHDTISIIKKEVI